MGTARLPETDGIEVIFEAPEWAAIGIDRLVSRAVAAALADSGLDPGRAEIAVLACDDARIAALNGRFRDRHTATNVLAFPALELATAAPGDAPPPPADRGLGDIAIAWQTCAREAAEADKPVADHATHLLVHATLHLLGYRHDREGDARAMEARETRILAGMGLPDPYDGGPAPARADQN